MKNYDFSSFSGELILKDNRDYNEKRMCFNRAIDKKPLAIAYCTNTKELKEALYLIKTYNLPFRIRSGTHHYEGFSTGDDIFIIDVSKMNKIDINLNENTVTIEGGVRNREVYEAVGKYDIPFPGGGCPTVGVSAYTLGGGWGYSARHLGLGIDSLISIELMNSKGEILVASEEENSELFYALKGSGGGNFGIVTKLKFNLPKKEKDGTLVLLEKDNIKVEYMAQIFLNWDKNINLLDEKLNMKVAFYNDKNKGLGIKIIGIFYGKLNELNKELEKIINLNEFDNISKEMSILNINRWIQDAHPDYEKYKSTGRFTKDEYKYNEILEILNILKSPSKGAVYTAISLYGLGKATYNKNGEDSFYYRNSKGIIGFQSVWEEDIFSEENKEFVVKNFEIIRRLTKGSFVSFPLKELDNYMEEYFGEYRYKLKAIKEKYDKENFFKFEQEIK
ncbi:MAG: FAD-binding protein [Clostridium sp.]